MEIRAAVRCWLLLSMTTWTAHRAAGEDGIVDGPVIGIDLGTTYSCVGVFKNGLVEIIPNDQGNRVTPSYVALAGDSRLVGEAAKNQVTANPSQTVYDVKRFIGKKFKDQTVQHDMKSVPFKVVDQSGKPAVEIEVSGQSKVMTPEELSGMLLRSLKEAAETYLGTPVKHAVITVPAHFNDAQRQATKDAGAIAGLNVLRVLNEPTAAALAYGMDKVDKKTILIYDLGGGTFDVSVLRIETGNVEVLGTAGEAHLGGEDFDQRVINHLVKTLKKKSDKDISKDLQAMQKLRVEVEKGKRRLSSTHQSPIRIDAIADGVDLKESLSRAMFEKLNDELFKKTLESVKRVLEDAKLKKSDIDEVVLIGGSTRIPKVQALVKEFFDGKEPTRGINPDEAVAYGAAIQAGMLSSQPKVQEVLLTDVAPLSLGLETVGGVMTTVISRNCALPAKNKTKFTTHYDNQHGLNFKVFQGERPLTKHNHLLGTFKIRGIQQESRGKPQIEVTFEVDANGMLSVKAEDLTTGSSETTVLKNDEDSLSPDQIEKMVKEAEEFAEADAKAKANVDAKTALQVYLMSLKAAAEKPDVSEDDKTQALDAVNGAMEWLAQGQDFEAEELHEKRQEVEGTVVALASLGLGEAEAASDAPKEEEGGGGHDEL